MSERIIDRKSLLLLIVVAYFPRRLPGIAAPVSCSWTWSGGLISPLGDRPSKRNSPLFCSREPRSQTWFLGIHTQADSHTAAAWRHPTTRPAGRRQALSTQPDAPSQNPKRPHWQRAILVKHTINWKYVWHTPFKPRVPFDYPKIPGPGYK